LGATNKLTSFDNIVHKGIKTMGQFRHILVALTATAALGMAANAHADSGGVRVGALTCDVSSGWGFVFGSSRDLNCTFSTDSAHVEHYTGKISSFGVDIGYRAGGVLAWGVFAPTGDLAPGSLEGAYGGPSASASAGVGVGANALVGGSGKTVSLQPLSIEGTVGLNAAAGVTSITLNFKP
jgi:hypothetical protein